MANFLAADFVRVYVYCGRSLYSQMVKEPGDADGVILLVDDSKLLRVSSRQLEMHK